MKRVLIGALAMLASIPAFGQDQASCKAYFQVLRAKAGAPGLVVGMDSGQKRWWENKGQKKYPGLCLNGSVTSGDKPRYLVIWSRAKSIGQSSIVPGEVYGQSASALQATAPTAYIYKPRLGIASVTVLYVSYDGGLLPPPIYLAPGSLRLRLFGPDSARVFRAAVEYLHNELVFSPRGY